MHELVEELFDDTKEMTLEAYQDKAAEYIFYKGALLYPTLGLNGEAGEFTELVKRLHRDDEMNFLTEDFPDQLEPDIAFKMARELGDVRFYLAACAGDIGYSLDEIAELNIEKLTDRKERGTLSGSGDFR